MFDFLRYMTYFEDDFPRGGPRYPCRVFQVDFWQLNKWLGKMMIETRRIQEQDHSDILAVAEALGEWFDSDARGRAIPADIRRQDGFVTLSQGRIVGFITLFVAEGRLNIGWMGVRPDCQNKGFGRRLLDRAEQLARDYGLSEIATYTLGDRVDYKPYEATREFYFKRGFTIYQRSTTDNPSCPEEIKIKKLITQQMHAAER